jgi:hypothetical protein
LLDEAASNSDNVEDRAIGLIQGIEPGMQQRADSRRDVIDRRLPLVAAAAVTVLSAFLASRSMPHPAGAPIARAK